MKRAILLLAAIPAVAAVSTSVSAQRTAPTTTPQSATVSIDDPNILNSVIASAIRYGKLTMVTKVITTPTPLPTGTLVNENGAKIVVEDGVITYFGRPGGALGRIGSTRLTTEHKLYLTFAGSTNEIALPDGTYKSADQRVSLNITLSKPSQFVLPGSTQAVHDVENQPAPIRR